MSSDLHNDAVYNSNNKDSEEISYILAPENIDSSKFLHLFNENFEVSLESLISYNEIYKIFNFTDDNKKDDFKDLVNKTEFLKLIVKENKEYIKLVINENFTMFSLLNIPVYCNKYELLDQLKIVKNNILNKKINRFYKKSLYWIITTEDLETAKELQIFLKKATVKDKDNVNIEVKYDISKSNDIIKSIKNKLSLISYNKDANNLKKPVKTYNINDANNQKLSWRKKSNDTNEVSYNNNNSNNHKNSGMFQRSSNANSSLINNFSNKIRDRYHSDGQKFDSSFKPTPRFQEIEIDLSKIYYSLKIKHKYNNGDILLYYDKFRINKAFEKPFEFQNFIEEICSKNKRKEFNFLKRERRMTYSIPLTYKNSKFDDVKLNLDAPSYNIPSSNPLSGGVLTDIQINK